MRRLITLFALVAAALSGSASTPSFTVDATRATAKISPRLYGLMTEEINHCYDGGLYAELIQNRAFLDDAKSPAHWSAIAEGDASATLALDPANPLNAHLPTSVRLAVTKASSQQPAGIANDGYWGIPVRADTSYRASFWAKAEAGYTGSLTAAIVSDDGRTIYAAGEIAGLSTTWKKFQLTLKTGAVAPTTHARFALTLNRPGTVWLGLVSLFPPTWNDRPNGLRKDLMQMLVDLRPKFLRFPGGNYLEGDRIEDRFPWQKTLGPLEDRPGHACPWGYRSSDGMGLLEFLEWCEDMGAEPVLAVYAGYSLKGDFVQPGAALEPFVQDALDEIEYVIGDASTKWGARRVQDGHPAPFALTYVEVGNEDFFDKSGSYEGRFAQFHRAIKAKYPQLKIISSVNNLKETKSDVIDEHMYSSAEEILKFTRGWGTNYDRKGPEIFVGEWAAHESPTARPWDAAAKKLAATPTMTAAIGDAAFMAAMERNADIVSMHCYAPLLVNVNPGAYQWRPDLIGYDALSSYGSPSYYAFQMFSRHVGDELLAVAAADTAVQGCATRDSRTGEIILKLVNPNSSPELLAIDIKGGSDLTPEATAITLAGKPEDTNSLRDPKKIVPVTSVIRGVARTFTHTLPPNSVVVLRLKIGAAAEAAR